MKKIIFTLILLINIGLVNAQNQKPRVIVMTDGEVDDRCSMVRFLLYTNDVEVEAIIETNSVFQIKGWSSSNWLEEQLKAYTKVYQNLKVHDKAYPSPNDLKSLVFVGDEDSTHLVVDHNAPQRIPGQTPLIDPASWKDTPGSDKIVAVLLEEDSRPVHIQAWGGGNTAARAFYKLKTQYPKEYKRAISKVVMYHIWYQDAAGSYIETYHPEVTMVLSHYFSGTWDYGSQVFTKPFVSNYLRIKENPLGNLYPQKYISEGDSPAFLYSLGNGLRSDENPTYGGWGGRFYKVKGFENVYRDVDKGSYARWVEYANRDFQSRLQWCISSTYEDANHKPKIIVKGGLNKTVKSGKLVEIEAEFSDNDALDLEALWEKYGPILEQHGQDKSVLPEFAKSQPKFKTTWWQYTAAGTYMGTVKMNQTVNNKITFVAPKVSTAKTVHIIIEVTDKGSPGLTAFARVIVSVLP